MKHGDSSSVILPFRADDLRGLPHTRVREVFVIDGVPHQLTVSLWGDDTYAAELVNLVSGASCPLDHLPDRGDRVRDAFAPSHR